MTEPREGIYFGLPEADYHADPALGSSSMKQLAVSPPDYWFNSPHNTVDIGVDDDDDAKATPAQVLGTAYHKLVLEGLDAFKARYGVKQHNWSTKEGKAEREVFESRGKIALKEEDWNRIMLANGAVEANPNLVNAFKNGPTEVSIFWNASGVPKKARVDCLKLRSNADLKTIAPMDGMDFPAACTRAMANYRYDVQAEHYNEARHNLFDLIQTGKVYGSHDADALLKIAGQASWSSVFVFLKKKGAPLTWACSIGPKSPLLQVARGTILKAEENYRSFKERFGLDTPWLTTDPVQELAIEEMPPWFAR